MKILGKTDSDSFIVEISKEEISNIRGTSQYCDMKSFDIGTIVKIDNIYHNAREVISSYENFKSLTDDLAKRAKFLTKLLNTKDLEQE